MRQTPCFYLSGPTHCSRPPPPPCGRAPSRPGASGGGGRHSGSISGPCLYGLAAGCGRVSQCRWK